MKSIAKFSVVRLTDKRHKLMMIYLKFLTFRVEICMDVF